jgi:DNA-binding NarL/FixJ family response regulator
MTLIVSESDCERIVMQVDRVKPAVILVDLDMPGRMGLEIISRLHRAQLNVAIIALSNLRCYRQITLTTGANEAIDKLKIATELEPAIRCAVL